MITFNNKKYYLEVLELKPADAVSIIETDMSVDFAPPLDLVEEEKKKQQEEKERKEAEKEKEKMISSSPRFIPFSGTGYSIKNSPKGGSSVGSTSPPSTSSKKYVEESDSDEDPTAFKAFSGTGNSLKKK